MAGFVDSYWRPPPPRQVPPKPAPAPRLTPMSPSPGVPVANVMPHPAAAAPSSVPKRKDPYRPAQAALGGLQVDLGLDRGQSEPGVETELPESAPRVGEEAAPDMTDMMMAPSMLGLLRSGMGTRMYPTSIPPIPGAPRLY